MEVELKAGAKFQVVTPKEMREALQSFMRDWQVEAAKGPRARRWSGRGIAAADGTLAIGGLDAPPDSGVFGPDQSLIWSLKRLNVQGLKTMTTASVWINSAHYGTSVVDGVTGYQRFGSDELVLLPGDRILITATGQDASSLITVAGSAWELPASMMYRLV